MAGAPRRATRPRGVRSRKPQCNKIGFQPRVPGDRILAKPGSQGVEATGPARPLAVSSSSCRRRSLGIKARSSTGCRLEPLRTQGRPDAGWPPRAHTRAGATGELAIRRRAARQRRATSAGPRRPVQIERPAARSTISALESARHRTQPLDQGREAVNAAVSSKARPWWWLPTRGNGGHKAPEPVLPGPARSRARGSRASMAVVSMAG